MYTGTVFLAVSWSVCILWHWNYIWSNCTNTQRDLSMASHAIFCVVVAYISSSKNLDKLWQTYSTEWIDSHSDVDKDTHINMGIIVYSVKVVIQLYAKL